MDDDPRNLPDPACPHGYDFAQVDEIFGAERDGFYRWVSGKTQILCPGLRGPCAGNPHGPVVFADDVRRYLQKASDDGR